MLRIVLAVLGYIIALGVNIFVPSISGIEFQEHQIFSITVNSNDLYRFLLIAIIVVYVITGFVSLKNKEKKKKFKKKIPFRIAVGIALAVWDVAGTKLAILPQPFFPGPAGIAEAFLEDGMYVLENTLYSIRLFAVGFSIGVISGIITGVVTGYFPKIAYWINPILDICGVIPPVAWMPFALIIFPESFAAAAFLLVICVWFPVATMTASGVSGTPKAQFEAARTLGAGTVHQIFTVAIPHAMPQIFVGITTAEAFAFTNLVMAEMMGQPGGLGYYINASKVWSAYYKVFAAIVVMAVLFSLIKLAIDKLQKHMLRWQKGIVK